MSALIIVGVGLGVGEGVGLGVGEGVGLGVCACAAGATPMASTKAMAAARRSLRPAPVSLARDGREEQRMHPIPNSSASSKTRDADQPGAICPEFTGTVNRLGSLAGTE
jgi:hypothetical protein